MGFIRDYILKPEEEQFTLRTSVKQTLLELRAAQQRFETETDPDLIDACIYRRLAAEAEYRYLHRKMLGGSL